MDFELDFYSSEVERVEVAGDTLSVVFSAAHGLRAVAPGLAPVRGYASGVVLRFEAARWEGDPARFFGGLADGWLEVASTKRARLRLPLSETGGVRAELRLISGVSLLLAAAAVYCDAPAAEAFTESYAC
ncbi:hypothetical protein GCM10025771_12200 [Niveibacterium umoris]|uniref:Uncharacterized protein n=1 Tax=Niveibacterium umoris TaxID=1193620 RepID=A0A840BJ18_9RHOO|nr:hypothetical protein [Niveibacterium umoris]MBB4013225.1 hypothetical protein [Niveibacterium umoris]